MSSSPKFRITVQGIMAGVRAERVRLALGKQFSLTPAQVEQLLANQAGPLVGLKEHQDAFELRNSLQQLGIECSIAPVPRSNLAGIPRQVALQSMAPDRHVGHIPRPVRASHHANSMRSGKVVSRLPLRNTKPLFSIPPLLRVAALVLVALVAGLSLQLGRDRPGETIVAAETGR